MLHGFRCHNATVSYYLLWLLLRVYTRLVYKCVTTCRTGKHCCDLNCSVYKVKQTDSNIQLECKLSNVLVLFTWPLAIVIQDNSSTLTWSDVAWWIKHCTFSREDRGLRPSAAVSKLGQFRSSHFACSWWWHRSVYYGAGVLVVEHEC